MADLSRTIEIILKGVDQTGAAFTSSAKNIEKLGKDLDAATEPFADVATKVLKVQGAVTTALVAIGGFAISAAGEFDDGVSEIQSLMGLTEDELDNFKSRMLGFFRDSTFDMGDILSATYQAISLGIPPDVVDGFLGSVETLAIAGGTDLTTAVNLLANTANAYGGTIDDISGYADTFFVAVQKGGTTIPELEEAIGKVIAIAAPFGVEIEEVAAAIAALTAMGVGNTAESATALQSLIQGLVNPTESAAKAAQELGINLGADVFKNKSFAEVIAEIGEKTGFSAGKIADMMTSTNGLKALLPLVNDQAKIHAEAIEAMAEKHGKAADAAEEMRKRFSQVNKDLVKSIKDVLIQIGLPLIDEYKGAVENITSVSKIIAAGIEAGDAKPLTDYFGSLIKQVGDFAADVAKVLPEAMKGIDWEPLLDSFKNMEGSIETIVKAIFGDIDMTTADGLGKAMQTIVNALAGLNNVSAAILTQLPIFFEAVSKIANVLINMDTGRLELIGKALGGALLLNIAAGAITGIAGTAAAIGTFATKITALATAGNGAITIAKIGPALVAAGILKSGAAFGAGYAVGTVIQEGIDSVVSKFTDSDNLGQLVYNWVNDPGLDSAETRFSDFVNSLDADVDIADEAIEKLRDKLTNLGFQEELTDLEVLKLGVTLDLIDADAATAIIESARELDGAQFSAGITVTTNVDGGGIDSLFDAISDADATVTITADADLVYDSLDDLNEIDGSYVDVSILPETGDLDGKLSDLAETEIPAADFVINSDLETIEDALAYLRDSGVIPIDVETGSALERLQDLGFEIDGMSEGDALSFEAQLAIDLGTSKADIAEITKEEEKEIDIRLQIEQAKADADIAVAEISGRFAVLQSMVEWRAKLDIAEVNANADKVIAIAGTIESAFSSSADIIGAAFGAMGDVSWSYERERIFEIIEREIDLRAEQVEMQKKLTDAEIKWMEARTKALDRGDAAITINGDGLQPHLEAFMWEILSTIQTRVTEEGLDMLLGVS